MSGALVSVWFFFHACRGGSWSQFRFGRPTARYFLNLSRSISALSVSLQACGAEATFDFNSANAFLDFVW